MTEKPKSNFAGEEKRAAPRATPDHRLVVSLNGGSLRIADISSGGITLYGPGIDVGALLQLDVHLGKRHLSAPVEILRVSEEECSHGRFIDLDSDSAELLHRYVEEIDQPL